MADLKVLCELSYPPWIFQVRNYFSVYRLFPIVTPLFDIVDLSLVINASSVGHYRGVMPDLREFTGDNTLFKWQRSHFYAHPRSSSLPNPCQMRKVNNEPGKLAITLFYYLRIWNPYVTAYFQQRSISGCPDASVAALRFTVGSRNDVAPVVAGSEWGVG